MAQLENGILQHRGEFARHHVMFQVLVLNIRTEAARAAIDPENRAIFTSVAADMENMARQMHATVETTFSELEAIVREAENGRQQLQVLEAALQKKARASIDTLRAELHSLELSLAPCLAANQEISQRLLEARARTGELITALQYQDIVRQQLAHVGEGFTDMGRHLVPGGEPVDLAYLHRSARVQATHLQTARQSIMAAGEAITGSGRGLLAAGAELVRHYTGMQQVAAGIFLHNRLGEMFKTETGALVEISHRSESTNQRIARLLDRIERTVRVFSGEIARHEYDVQLIALNAQIAAARLTEARALNKLTEETALLSAVTAQLARETGQQLAAMLDRLQAMRTDSDGIRKTIDGEKADLAQSGVNVEDKLARLNHRIQQATGNSAVTFTRVYERVNEQLAGLQFPDRIAAAFAPGEEICSGLIATCAPFASADLTQAGSDRLAAHQDRYTMDAERAAHHAAIATADTPRTSPATAAATSSPDTTLVPAPLSIGTADDGVELF